MPRLWRCDRGDTLLPRTTAAVWEVRVSSVSSAGLLKRTQTPNLSPRYLNLTKDALAVNESALKETCPECGLEIPAGAGCPGCSLRLALSPESVTPLIAKRPLPPGLKSRFFGDYEILNELARGGMGVVYRARQLGLNRLVALKMVQSSHLLSDEARLRFRVEIEAVAQLNHPHIVSLYESGEQDGAHYFTMRLVEGGDLSARLKQERPLRERVQLLVKVCRAVHYAHQRGILHRDLKPSNILVDGEGEPHVADFGLAKSLDHDTGFTFTSSVLGSPNYMAPEQASGKIRQLTTAVDVYGLGAILYHLLAGRPPFQAKTPIETLRQVLDNDPAPPRSADPQADRDLETIALKCLRKEPGARYGTAEELAQDLERWLAGDPILARPLGPFATVWRWSRRHPAAAALGAALVMALAAIVVGTAIAAVRIQRAEERSAGHLRESFLREASSLRLGSEWGHRDEGLRLIGDAVALGGSPEFRARARNELLATMVRIDPEFLATQATNANPKPSLNAIHTRFQMGASVEDETNVVFRAFEDGTLRGRLVSRDGPVTRVDLFSPNGYFLALRHPGMVSIWDLRSGKRSLVRAGTNLTFAFHPIENAIVIQESPNEAVWLDLPSGTNRFRWTAPLPRPAGRSNGWQLLNFSPDGRTLAASAANSFLVEFMNPTNGEIFRVITNNSRTVAMSWSRDSDSFAVATADSRVLVWDPATGRLEWTSPTMIGPAHSLAFHPYQDWLVAGCRDGKVRFIDTHQQRFVFEYSGESRQIGFSPYGVRLGPVWSDGQFGFLEIHQASAFTSFGVSASMNRLTDGAFSPDGRLLVLGHSDAAILCNPRLGRMVSRIKQDWRGSTCTFHPLENYLLARDAKGISRFTHELDGARLSLSSPELIHPGVHWRAIAITPDGQRFAGYHNRSNAVFVFDQTLTNRLASFGPHTAAESLAISPDGRWLTTGSSGDGAVRIWDVAGEKVILSLPAGSRPRSAFSSDGRWLVATGDRFELREVGATWKPAPSLQFSDKNPVLGAAAFSPDSRMLAMVVNRFEIHLFDLQTFASLGILRPPSLISMLGLTFSPDGSQLAAFGAEARVAVWNLREMHERLAEYGLAWDSRHGAAGQR
jgi:eukaryotic-like serine/threonine-protein kinase